jgi:hypothetical protein
MRRLYLISAITDSFGGFCRHFVEVCGGQDSRLAVLLQGSQDWQSCFDQYSQHFSKYQPAELFPVFPDEVLNFSQEMIEKTGYATGFFAGGGNIHRYISAYTQSPFKCILFEKYFQGVPYAGLSAGAIITTRLNILPGFAIKPHFSNQNRFFELIAKMQKDDRILGLGMDDGIWVEIVDDNQFIFHGNGKCYLFDKMEDTKFGFEIFEPGMIAIL